MTDQIAVTLEAGVKTLRFNRPEKKNALTGAMYHRLADEMIAADDDPETRAILFLGAGGDFTTGNDIGDFMKVAMGGGGIGADSGVGRFLRQQIDGTTPLIAGVQGLAVGVGATMLMQCDLVYAARSADIRTPFLDLGLVAENASSYLGPKIMGHQKAFELLCLGEPFDGARAYDAGLVNRVCENDELEALATDAARRVAAKPPEAMRLTRELMRGDRDRRREASAAESRIFGERLKSDEAKAAFMAFMSRKSA